jgi:hypothetical protein
VIRNRAESGRRRDVKETYFRDGSDSEVKDLVRERPLVWGFFCQPLRRGSSFSSSVSLFDLKPVSSPRPTSPRHCRAQGLSRLAVAPTLPPTPIIARPYLDGSEHDGTLGVVGMTLSRGARLVGARIAPHACIRWVSYDPNHDAVMRIGSEAPRRRTHSLPRHQSHADVRDPATSNCHRRPVAMRAEGPKLSDAFSDLRLLSRTEGDALGHHAITHEVPQGDQKFARQGHDHGFARTAGVLPDTTVPGRSPSGT